MSGYTLKIGVLALGSAFVGVGAIFSEGSKDNSLDYATLKAEDLSQTLKKPKRKPNWNICNVFWADYDLELKNGWANRKFTKFKEEFWTKEEFLKNIKDNKVREYESLTTKVEERCKTHKKVYVWWGKHGGTSETWIYDENINTKDWLNESGVDIPSNLRQQD